MQFKKYTPAAFMLSSILVTPVWASVIGGWGAFAEVRTCQNEVIGCPGPGGTDETLTSGGEFANSAQVSTSPGNTTGTGAATVAFTEDAFAPSLGAFASTAAGSRNATESVALAIQSWTYGGPTSTDYTVMFALDGTLDTSASGSSAALRADFAIYLWDNASFFTGDLGTFLFEAVANEGTLIDNGTLFLLPGLTIDSALSTFTVNPGDQLYVLAQLEAKSERGGIADASSTLRVLFTGGNTSLLDALAGSAVAVPVPATHWLLLPFVGLVSARHRRHRG